MRRFRTLLLKAGFLLVLGVFPAPPGLMASGLLDLGRSLAYLRMHGRPDDAQALAAAWSRPALIVDLRYPAAGAAGCIPGGLQERPRSAPLFVLVGPATPAPALDALRHRAPALITIGLAAPGLAPDIALPVNPGDDRRAYDALDSGAPVGSLIEEKPAAQRFDESSLLHERAQGRGAPDASAAEAPAAAAAPQPEPRDAVLQRAVQLHRTLLALGRLPGV